jgi:hypothetical protein
MTCLYSDKVSAYMIRHGCSRTKAKHAMRRMLRRERQRNDMPVRGTPIAGTGKPTKGKKT